MTTLPVITDALPYDLGNGLLLRRSTRADAEPLAEFNRWIFREPGVAEPDEGVAVWTRELLSGQHPTFGEGDFTLVVDQATGKIVSSLNLISQTWTYAGIPFRVGRIELVGTAPEYRKRGLIRAQFEVIHKMSAARGEIIQGITGIPFYYRQFGYEMALSLGGGRVCYKGAIPAPKKDATGAVAPEPFTFRAVDEGDLPFVMALDAYASRKSLVNAVRDETMWRFELFGHSPGHCNRLEHRIIQTATGEAAGLVGFLAYPWGANRVGVLYLELAAGWSYVEASASILRGLKAEAEIVCSSRGKTFENLYLNLGDSHPFYEANHDRLSQERPPYAWYIRVPDLPAFLKHIAPALEARLDGSWAAGHTGEIKISFYRSGLRLALERGKFTAIEPWMPTPYDDEGDAGFPGLTFLQLVFGYRDLGQLRIAFPDVWAGSDEVRGLITALFPYRRTRFLELS